MQISSAQVTDIDGNNYKTVKIGKQIWTAENLKVTRLRNGDSILHVADRWNWRKHEGSEKPIYGFYEADSLNEEKYGNLYNWHVVHDDRNIAPQGWHVPSWKEWQELLEYMRGNLDSENLKSTDGWYGGGNGTDEFGFTALPGGYRNESGSYRDIGKYVSWWGRDEKGTAGYIYILKHDFRLVEGYGQKVSGRYIRLIKD